MGGGLRRDMVDDIDRDMGGDMDADIAADHVTFKSGKGIWRDIIPDIVPDITCSADFRARTLQSSGAGRL
jgi:hypothetical protein